MKTSIKLLMVLLAAVTIVSCVQEDDYDVPQTEPQEIDLNGRTTTIGGVQGEFIQAQDDDYDEDNFTIVTYDDETDESSLFMEGYVISTDEGGNYFEELILQDAPENPTAGIRLRIDVNPLFTKYDVGRKVFIKLDGLSVGLDSGVLTLGVQDGEDIGQVPAALESDVIVRSPDTENIVPLDITIEELLNGSGDNANVDNEFLNLFVRLNDVQFNRAIVDNPDDDMDNDESTTYASEPEDRFDGERQLESCNSNASIIFSTSTFSDFKSLTLPAGRGSIAGIPSLNFFGEDIIFSVNTPENVILDNPERCDPLIVSCGTAESEGTTTVFADDFEGMTPGTPVSGNGWTNFAEAGSELWETFMSDEGDANESLGVTATIGSFRSGDDSNINWLVMPVIDLDASAKTTLRFVTSNSFSDGSELEILFSKDWDGVAANIPDANWGLVEDAFVVGDDDNFRNYFDSGIVDLSCETGQVYIAFKYTGSGDRENDGTYELDNVRIAQD